MVAEFEAAGAGHEHGRHGDRRGIAEALMRYAIDLARERGADVMTLSSNHTRDAANQLYQSMGFQKRDTNSYIYKLR